MKWKIQYCNKGETKILNEVVDVHFTNKRDVQKWWISKSAVFINYINSTIVGGYREDKIFINCQKIKWIKIP